MLAGDETVFRDELTRVTCGCGLGQEQILAENVFLFRASRQLHLRQLIVRIECSNFDVLPTVFGDFDRAFRGSQNLHDRS